MADNTVLNEGTGGDTAASAEVTFSGDTTKVYIAGLGLISGSAESYSVNLVSAGAGTVGTGVQRITLASDDPAVVDLAAMEVLLTTIDADTGAIKTAVELIDDAVAVEGAALGKGVLLQGDDGTDRTNVLVDTDGHLQIDVLSAPTTAVTGTFWQATQPVSGSVTANAGTNLNTSALALETGGNLAAAVTALEIIDDWDESNRAKVNLIAGQVGIAGGTGVDGATVPRMTLATNVALPAGDNNIGNVDIVKVGSVVDDNNSTQSTLGIGASFVPGSGTDLIGYSAVCVTIYADVDSAADGMKFEFSTNDTNWDDSYSFTLDFSVSPTRRFQFPVTARYFRVNYTNGGGAQSAFRVQTILHTANQLTSIHKITDDLSPDRSAQVVKAALFAQKAGSGDLTLIDATSAGNLKVAIEEFDTSLPAGTNAIGKLAANSGVDIGDVDVTSIAAGTNTIGGTISQPSTSTAYDGTTACTLKRKSGVMASTGDILAQVSGKKFRILALFLKATSATATNIFLSTTTDSDVLGDTTNRIPLAVDADGDNDSGFVLPWNPGGWTETSTANEALTLNMSAAQDIIYAITYIEVD